MTALHGNRTSLNFSKLPLAFCDGFTLKKAAFWNRRPILQAGTTINQTIINFYHDIALNIPVSVRMDQTTNKMEEKLIENMTVYKEQNKDKESLSIEMSDDEVLMHEGDTDNQDCYILTKGILAIFITGVQVATISHAGMPVGEMSFLTGEARSATVIAKGSVTLLRLRSQDKNKILRNNPTISMTILEALVARLSDSNEKLITLRNKINDNTNKAVVRAEKLDQSYNTVVKALMREAGFKTGNMQILEKMLEVLEENLGKKLHSGSTHSVYRMFLDFVEYYRTQSINESIDGIILKENMSDYMKELF